MFTVLLPLDATGTTRKQFVEAMHREGVGIGISYEAIHLTSYFRAKGFREGQFPVSERIARETVTLPLFPELRRIRRRARVRAMARVLRRKAA
jgi:dTDP-4-amino-4,6-dideoxygalactose transaminase